VQLFGTRVFNRLVYIKESVTFMNYMYTITHIHELHLYKYAHS